MALGVTTFKVPTALTLSADVWQVLGLNQKYGSLGKPLGRQILRERDLAWFQVCPQQEGCPQASGKVHSNCLRGACTFHSARPAPLHCSKAPESRRMEPTSFAGFQSEKGWVKSPGVNPCQATPSESCLDSDPHSIPLHRAGRGKLG